MFTTPQLIGKVFMNNILLKISLFVSLLTLGCSPQPKYEVTFDLVRPDGRVHKSFVEYVGGSVNSPSNTGNYVITPQWGGQVSLNIFNGNEYLAPTGWMWDNIKFTKM